MEGLADGFDLDFPEMEHTQSSSSITTTTSSISEPNTDIDTDLSAYFSPSELQTALKVLSAFVSNPSLRSHASANPQVRTLLAHADQITFSTPEARHAKRLQKRREKKDKDQSMLENSGIRKLRSFRAKCLNGGSIPLLMPENGEGMGGEDVLVSSRKMLMNGLGGLVNGMGKLVKPASLVSSSAASTVSTAETAVEEQIVDEGETVVNGETTTQNGTPVEATATESLEQPADNTTTSSAPTTTPPSPSSSSSTPTPSATTTPGSYRTLTFARSCHICKNSFKLLHPFYDQLCPSCAEFNFTKRTQSADLNGKVALVTGARVKIGYCVAVKLLRCGATVIVTTRFPKDAAKRYASEADFEEWREKLFIYGLDFRNVPMIHYFCEHVRARFERLDIIINNAAQTVRKPSGFYSHLLKAEAEPLTGPAESTVVDSSQFLKPGSYLPAPSGFHPDSSPSSDPATTSIMSALTATISQSNTIITPPTTPPST
ncbi:hypothetical protein HK102_006514, partial [Quaeritorhiza haematococci]